MAITYSFADNTVYGTEDINDITKSLVGAGVAPFVSKDSYNVSDLNAMTSALVGTGVQLEGCKCTVQNKGTQSMSVFVAQGIVFFENGVRLTVDSNGYTIAVSPNTAGVVYAYYNQALQTADIMFAKSLPDSGEYVQLAKISVDGTLSDKREYARAKIATMGSNVAFEGKLVQTEYTSYKDSDLVIGHKRYAVGTVDADISGFNYAIASYSDHRCIFDLKKNIFFLAVYNCSASGTLRTVYTGSQKWYSGSGSNQLYGFEMVDGVLTFFTDIKDGEERYISYPGSITITLV